VTNRKLIYDGFKLIDNGNTENEMERTKKVLITLKNRKECRHIWKELKNGRVN